MEDTSAAQPFLPPPSAPLANSGTNNDANNVPPPLPPDYPAVVISVESYPQPLEAAHPAPREPQSGHSQRRVRLAVPNMRYEKEPMVVVCRHCENTVTTRVEVKQKCGSICCTITLLLLCLLVLIALTVVGVLLFVRRMGNGGNGIHCKEWLHYCPRCGHFLGTGW